MVILRTRLAVLLALLCCVNASNNNKIDDDNDTRKIAKNNDSFSQYYLNDFERLRLKAIRRYASERDQVQRSINMYRNDFINSTIFTEFANRLREYDVIYPRNSSAIISNVAFFKTHKTGSSTMTSILLRYGSRYSKRMMYAYPFPNANISHLQAWVNEKLRSDRLEYQPQFFINLI